MSLIVSSVLAALAVLGALHLLNDLAERSARPRWWHDIAVGRRAFMLVVTSALVGSVYTVMTYRAREGERLFRASLFEMELRLVQLEGLIFAALASVQQSIPPTALKSLESYLSIYSRRVFASVDQMRVRMSDREYTQLRVALRVIHERLEDLQSPKGAGLPNPVALSELLEAIGPVRQAIRDLM